jgi:hypothetical protein
LRVKVRGRTYTKGFHYEAEVVHMVDGGEESEVLDLVLVHKRHFAWQ